MAGCIVMIISAELYTLVWLLYIYCVGFICAVHSIKNDNICLYK